MSQFFSGSQSGSTNPSSNKQDAFRLPVAALSGTNNMAFSPGSEQNYYLESLFCPSYQSPMGSLFHAYSPYPLQPMLNTSELTTPIFLSNLARSLAAPQPDSVPGFKIPLKIDQMKLEGTAPIDPGTLSSQKTFRSFAKDSSTNLKNFLSDQLSLAHNPSLPPLDPARTTDPGPELQFGLERIPQGRFNSVSFPNIDSTNPLEGQSKDSGTTRTHPEISTLVPLSPIKSPTLLTTFQSVQTAPSPPDAPLPLHFEKPSKMLYRAFTEGVIDAAEFESLTDFEQELIYYLVKRKFQSKSLRDPQETTERPSFARLTQILQLNCAKRPEECYKFVLTRVIKALKHRYEVECKTKARVEELLYEVYFRETAERLQIPLSDFHYPLTGTLKGKFKLNSVYFARIFQSDSFVREIQAYCDVVLFPEYSKDIHRKLEALFSKWGEEILKAPDSTAEVQADILTYVKFNKRCKLPWTLDEVRESVDRFFKLMAGYRPTKSA